MFHSARHARVTSTEDMAEDGAKGHRRGTSHAFRRDGAGFRRDGQYGWTPTGVAGEGP